MTPWVLPMLEYIGVTEWEGPQHNPLILSWFDYTEGSWIETDEHAWCGAFQAMAVAESGYYPPKLAHKARSWLSWGRPAPKTRGAICVLQARRRAAARRTGSARGGYHVGTVMDFKPGAVQLISGNKNDKVGIDWYPLSRWRVRGYRLAG